MLIYFLRVPTATVIGTSMVLTLITMASATVMHAATNHLVDAVLALILMRRRRDRRAVRRPRRAEACAASGCGCCSASWCSRWGCGFAYQLVVQPGDLYSIRQVGAERCAGSPSRVAALAGPARGRRTARAERLVTTLSTPSGHGDVELHRRPRSCCSAPSSPTRPPRAAAPPATTSSSPSTGPRADAGARAARSACSASGSTSTPTTSSSGALLHLARALGNRPVGEITNADTPAALAAGS